MKEIWIAMGLTLFAGMATGVGSAIAFMAKRSDYRFLSVATGFSAGVMLYVSFVEIFFKGVESLVGHYGEYWGHWVNAAAFFGGILVISVIDNLIPAARNPHETHAEEEIKPLHNSSAPAPRFDSASASCRKESAEGVHTHVQNQRNLMRMGLFTALAIGIHNFPEGLATFLTALNDPGLGVAIAVAVALHNIPEGISVSVPIFYATGNRRKAFTYSLLSGLAEPAGAAVAYLLLRIFIGGDSMLVPPQVTGIIFGGIAGIMVYISLDELLPASRAYGKGHDSLLGLVGGMLLMSLSLLLMK
ncbi:MAG: zinc transporter ZupT [Desulfobacteraceae bacterium]|nr:MAG: zinc transporter ZupT [Desulfobacteraceae bacterium]